MTHEEKVARWIGPGKTGVEIGAFKSPVPGLAPRPFYVDRFRDYAGERCLADYYGDATELPFRDNSLDYVATSHVLEHVANPVLALREWYRVLRPGGIIYLLVPDRRYTWDHARPLTTVEHMLGDYERGTTQVDGTHIDDFVDGVDWSTYSPATAAADVPAKKAELKKIYHAAIDGHSEINIHFHVFEPSNLLALLDTLRTWPRTRLAWRMIDHAERFPANNPIGFLAVVQVGKTWRDGLAGWRNRRRTARDPKFPVLPGAKLFDP